jgi:hypothetical protein
VKGPCGYGRYNDSPEHVGCPRARTDMTPCIARDGHTALAAHPSTCVGCGSAPYALVTDLANAIGEQKLRGLTVQERPRTMRAMKAADLLRDLVRQVTEPVPAANGQAVVIPPGRAFGPDLGELRDIAGFLMHEVPVTVAVEATVDPVGFVVSVDSRPESSIDHWQFVSEFRNADEVRTYLLGVKRGMLLLIGEW